MLVEAIRSDGRVIDLVYRDVNRATCEYLGLSRDEMIGHSLLETLPNLDGSGLREIYIGCAETGEPVVLDGFPYHNEILDDLRYYDIRAAQVEPGFISLTWRDVTERSELTRRIALSEQRFRLLAENMADVVVRLRDGRISWISNSVEDAMGLPPGRLIGQRLADFVPPADRAEYACRASEVERGETSIGRARILDADGRQRWIHLHVKPFHEADGTPNGAVASFRMIDDEVAAEVRAREQIAEWDARNRSLTRRLQAQTDRLMSELNSAARYVASILPGDLDGPVRVSSCYVPSSELAGDTYDYRWIDDDHLVVYLIDVSGHGVEPAMVSVSVHNTLRSGTLDHDTLLHPDRTLTELNRLFRMDDHGGNYFTIWYGVYQASTRTLRYTGAGHPPVLVLDTGQFGGHRTVFGRHSGGNPGRGRLQDPQLFGAAWGRHADLQRRRIRTDPAGRWTGVAGRVHRPLRAHGRVAGLDSGPSRRPVAEPFGVRVRRRLHPGAAQHSLTE